MGKLLFKTCQHGVIRFKKCRKCAKVKDVVSKRIKEIEESGELDGRLPGGRKIDILRELMEHYS